MRIELIVLIPMSILVSITAADANHQDKHITIGVEVNDAIADKFSSYNIYVGIPEAKIGPVYDNLHNYEDVGIDGYDLETYTYNFNFYDIELNTPFSVCVELEYITTVEGIACKSGLTTTDNGHVPVELSMKDAKEY